VLRREVNKKIGCGFGKKKRKEKKKREEERRKKKNAFLVRNRKRFAIPLEVSSLVFRRS